MSTQINALRTFTGLLRNRIQMVIQDLPEVYRGDILRRREKITQLRELIKGKVDRAAKSELAGKMRVAKGFYTLEMSPPSTAAEMEKLKAEIAMAQEFIKTNGYKTLTVREAWLLCLVVMEVGLWFYLGETIGKFHIVGYKVCP